MIEYKATRDPKECPHPLAGLFIVEFPRRVECRDCGASSELPREIMRKLRQTPGGVLDKKFQAVPVQLNGATIFVAPEPGSAGLLGVGILGLACCGRTRKS